MKRAGSLAGAVYCGLIVWWWALVPPEGYSQGAGNLMILAGLVGGYFWTKDALT